MIMIERKLRQKYWKDLQCLREEIEAETPGWLRQRRRNYLREQMFWYLGELISFYQWYKEATEQGIEYIIKAIIGIFAQYEKWEEKLKRAKLEYDDLSNSKQDNPNIITQTLIEQAKEYPIEEIVEVNRQGFAFCAFHEDKHPSMYCKNNFYHCFSCQANGDTISLYQKLHNVDFKQAVQFLSRH